MVFEEATWTKENRRAFDIVTSLASQAGVEIPSHDDPTTPAEAAYAHVYNVGWRLLIASISVFCEGNRKPRRRLYKEVTGEGGARACVMLTVAVGKTVGDESANLLREHYQVLEEDDRFVRDALAESADLNLAAAVICARGLEIASSFSTARSTPPFERLGEADWRSLVHGGERELQNFEWRLVVDVNIGRIWTEAQGNYRANSAEQEGGPQAIKKGWPELADDEGSEPGEAPGSDAASEEMVEFQTYTPRDDPEKTVVAVHLDGAEAEMDEWVEAHPEATEEDMHTATWMILGNPEHWLTDRSHYPDDARFSFFEIDEEYRIVRQSEGP